MAKKKQTDPKAETAARIKRTEAYAERVRAMFAATVNQILALNRTLPKLQPGEMFSFDAQSLKKQNEVERLLRQLHSVATMAIQQGITLEWGQANAAADTLVKSVFGQEVLSSPEFKAWGGRNGAAMQAFINRSEKGLNLSDRVWKAVRQLREEMEVAITISVGEGQSAQKISQSVRQYLNDPDLMFRRFRYKAGEEIEYDEDGNEIGKKIIWGRKWKKRIKKPDGTYGWIDYDRDEYKTGAGVYKSSAKNAMRVARTETNIAYRRADHERWQTMDFVLGQRVSMSKDHPKKDICDKLAGDYPKDFVFDGWHPQCFCYVTPITIPPEETAKLTEMMLNGEDWRGELARLKRGREITSYPDNFKQWVTDNADNIQAARDRGTEPYFIRNNARAIDNIINPPKALTPKEIAAQRHAARTEEDKQKILNAWQERKERMEAEKKASHITAITSSYGNRVLDIMGDIPGVDTTALQAAIKAGDTTLIQEEAKKLRDLGKQFKTDAHLALGTASDYGEISGANLEAAIKAGNIKSIWEQTKALQTKITTTKKAESDLSDIIPDAHNWHKTFSLADLEATKKAVISRMARESFSSPAEKKRWLEREIKWVEDHKKYDTWPVAKAAYEKELRATERKVEEAAILTSVQSALAYALVTSDANYQKLVSEMRAILSTPNYSIAAAKSKASILNKAFTDLQKKESGDTSEAAVIGAPEKARRETIEEMRQRMGADAPKTLSKLEKAIAKYEASSKYGDEAKKHKAEIEEIMRKVFDEHDFGMNVDENVIELLLSSYFKNTFEVGGGHGYVGSHKTTGKIESSHGRLTAAHELFGLNKDVAKSQLPRHDYEKYGNLLDHNIEESLYNNTATQYGRIEVRFKKSSVVATWTPQDSLGCRCQPSLTSDPKACSFDDMRNVPHDTTESVKDLNKFKNNYIWSYLELQYHGELTLDCVESIAFPYDITEQSRAHLLQVARQWKARGVKVYFLTISDGLKQL